MVTPFDSGSPRLDFPTAAGYKNHVPPAKPRCFHGTTMARFFHPLLSLIACATRQELARPVHFLKVENRILRARLPQRIVVRPDERKKLLNAAKGAGKAIRELTSIVSPKSFLRWMDREM